MSELYNISVEREKSIFFELIKEFLKCKENNQLMKCYGIKEKYTKWLNSFYERNDNVGLFLFTEELKKYISENSNNLDDCEKSIIELNGILDVYDVLYERIVKENKGDMSDKVMGFIDEARGLICEFRSLQEIPKNDLNNYFDRVLNLCSTSELCCFINEFRAVADATLKEVDSLYYSRPTSIMFSEFEQVIKAKVVNNEYGMCKMEEKMNSFELMSLASQKVYDENPDKKTLIDEYVYKFKKMGEEVSKTSESKILSSQQWENLSKDKNTGECIKRNISNLSFTKAKILAERKRLLQEINATNAKMVILHGDSGVISNVLFDYKIGKGRVLAVELAPIFSQVDFAIKEFVQGDSKVVTLYEYCKKKNVTIKPDVFCGCSKEEALLGSTKYPGATLSNYIAIGYFPNSRINKTRSGKNGNIESFEPGNFKAFNVSTGEVIDDFRVVSRREKENGKGYVKKA